MIVPGPGARIESSCHVAIETPTTMASDAAAATTLGAGIALNHPNTLSIHEGELRFACLRFDSWGSRPKSPHSASIDSKACWLRVSFWHQRIHAATSSSEMVSRRRRMSHSVASARRAESGTTVSFGFALIASTLSVPATQSILPTSTCNTAPREKCIAWPFDRKCR